MRRAILAGLLLAGSCATAFAQNTPEECGALDDGAERLVCYDLLYRVDRSSAKSGPDSQWTVRTDTSRIDDSTNVFMTVQSTDTFQKRFGGEGRGAMLVRCMENTTTLYFTLAGHHLADLQSYGRVTYRIDDAPAQTKRFTESTDSQALGLWNGGSSIPFIKSLFGADNLLVQITPFSESAITVDFPIAGLEEEIAPLREACNW